MKYFESTVVHLVFSIFGFINVLLVTYFIHRLAYILLQWCLASWQLDKSNICCQIACVTRVINLFTYIWFSDVLRGYRERPVALNELISWCQQTSFPTNIYLFKVNNRNTRKRVNMPKGNTKRTRTTSWRSFDVVIINSGYIPHLCLLLLLVIFSR